MKIWLIYFLDLGNHADSPDTDDVVSVAGEQSGTVGGPREREAVWNNGFWTKFNFKFWSKFIDNNFRLEIPNLNARVGRGAEPVSVGGEDECVDDAVSLEGVQAFALVQIPEHGRGILTTGCAQGAVWRNGDRVEVTSVTLEVVAKLAVGQVPDLDKVVPAAADNERVGGRRREADAGDPFGVSILLDGVLALAESVPKFDGLVARAGNNLTVVGGEGNGEDILGVANEATGGLTSAEIPEAEGSVPGATEGKLCVRRDDDILNKVRVAAKCAHWLAVVVLITSKTPVNDGLVARRREDHLRVFWSGGDGRDPARVATHFSAEDDRFRHD